MVRLQKGARYSFKESLGVKEEIVIEKTHRMKAGKNQRSNTPRGVLKICSKLTGEHPCRSVISIKLQNKV